MRFTVIITLYNKAPYIARALRSILTQEKSASEIVIVDDASTDNSLVVARQTLEEEKRLCCGIDIKVIEHKKNGGPSIARNTALKAVTGDYVFLLDADDEYHAGFFSRAEHIFKTYDATLLFY